MLFCKDLWFAILIRLAQGPKSNSIIELHLFRVWIVGKRLKTAITLFGDEHTQ
jgi:hypothetical protein